MRLIRTLLATDRKGNPRALARRMGVQGLIFDCRAWWAGMERMDEYSYCYRGNGEANWKGAREQTSFWRSPLAR